MVVGLLISLRRLEQCVTLFFFSTRLTGHHGTATGRANTYNSKAVCVDFASTVDSMFDRQPDCFLKVTGRFHAWIEPWSALAPHLVVCNLPSMQSASDRGWENHAIAFAWAPRGNPQAQFTRLVIDCIEYFLHADIQPNLRCHQGLTVHAVSQSVTLSPAT